ncbi:MAG: hypothetical protein A2846_02560 [Candidatus Doudnabacteria bacterium RIFCSPHIGHO2_01_FULL_49_9]|uniref:Four helix bundle protein n=1 Tax=Candidatus Doudnabacteria bacterium RIFCSPHIGHO2_01_FULL_49_9 TaxID=1817827 RepID=A0A1F5P3F4_9BACT|nr:MAG: hypothetical protein A2846_02560 [Candidatus Doudnabacteria bacterium RIFCSPHIGHO2_01_FULL_49_9]
MTYNSNPNPTPPRGAYRRLRSFHGAEIIYDFTVEFCRLYIDRTYGTNRTHDQMVQAARSGKQNIADLSSVALAKGEGSKAASQWATTEIKLVNVARASLEELLLDYEDFLRQQGLPKWDKDDPRARALRDLARLPNKSYKTYSSYLSSPEPAANCMITLINQTNFLLDQQIKAIRGQFDERGISPESHQNRAARLLAENRKNQAEFDAYLQQFLKKKP